MNRVEFVRTTAFRWTLAVAGAFVLGMALLAGFIYWETVEYLSRRDGLVLREEAQEAVQGQPADQVASVEEYLQSDPAQVKIAGIFDSSGHPIAGNLRALPSGLPRTNELGELRLPVDAGLGSRRHSARVLTEQLSGGRLLIIGRAADSVHELEQIVSRALGLALLPMLLLALTIGFFISRAALRRIAAMHRSSQLIMAGKLNERLPTRGTADDFDQLARIVNAMLDEIERLMLEVKGVGEDVAHDLRTPLTRLRIRFERAMSAAPVGGELGPVLAAGIEDIDQILTTISAILRIAEIEHGERRAGFRPIDLHDVMREAVDLYEPIAEDKRVSLRISGDSGERAGSIASVMGNGDLMFEAVSNLIDNAIKFSPPGGSVTVTLRGSVNGPRIQVNDGGPGIRPEDWGRVARRFFRADRSRHTEGSGLGLSLVAAIVRLHGFELTLDPSQPGCCMTIECWPHERHIEAPAPQRIAVRVQHV
jgi:signal transduction histidine kinase